MSESEQSTFLVLHPGDTPPSAPSKRPSAEVRRERDRQAFELWLMGYTKRRIKEVVGFRSITQVDKILTKEMVEYVGDSENIDEAYERAYVDRLMQANSPDAFRGDPRAVETALRLVQARSRARGLESDVAPSDFQHHLDRAVDELADLKMQLHDKQRRDASGDADVIDGEVVDEDIA